jgi:hypothetical protein
MTDKFQPETAKVPRRTLLRIGLFGVGASALVAAFPAAASTKLSQKAAHYQATPKGSARCDNCNQFQAPGACKVVDGDIAPAGWCTLYVVKH